MSLFGTPIKKLTFDDLDELVKTKAQENVRIEFKEMPVDKDGFLKKLSSFANTNGGYLILGMAEGPNNTARELCGVSEQPSFEAQISAWCAKDLYPPLVPSVSNPIGVPGKGTYAYVIYVEESELAPHFIEGRKGCFVRTNETSHKFDAEFANTAELQALFNRREQARRLLVELKARSEERIDRRQSQIPKNVVGPLLPFTISVRPMFPRKPIVPLKDLADIVLRSSVNRGGGTFPDTTLGVYSQSDALIVPSPRNKLLTFLEVTRFATSSYTEFFQADPIPHEKIERDNSAHVRWAKSMSQLLGAAWLGLKFARNVATNAGFHGLLEVSLDLRSKAEVAFCYFDDYNDPKYAAVQPNDERIQIVREVQVDDFRSSWVDLAVEMWRELYFSLGWHVALADVGDDATELAKVNALKWLRVEKSFLSS